MEEEKLPERNIGSDGANVIGNAEDQADQANRGMAKLRLNSGKSSMRTRAAYKAGHFVNLGVQKTQEYTQEEIDQME